MTGNGDQPPIQQEDSNTRTSQQAAAHELIQQVGHFVQLLNITHEALLCADGQCRIVLFNQGAEKLFGYSRDEAMGQTFIDLVCRQFRETEKHRVNALTRIAHENPFGFTTDKVVFARKNGQRFPGELSLSRSEPGGQRLYTLIVRDISERLNQQRQLEHLAEHDHLTDLPNRVKLDGCLPAAIARADRYGRKLGVVYLDLDQFKPINDTYGHETGDCLLQAVAQRLNETMRQTDTVSRIGGDEFIICLEQIKTEQDAVAATRKLVRILEAPFQILGQTLTVSASIGVAIYPDHGETPDALLQHADQAMYQAKSSGHSPVIYQPESY